MRIHTCCVIGDRKLYGYCTVHANGTFLCDCVTLETNMKSLPSSVRQLLMSRCTASSSRNSRNAYPADRERRGGGGKSLVNLHQWDPSLARRVLYTWWYTTEPQQNIYRTLHWHEVGCPFKWLNSARQDCTNLSHCIFKPALYCAHKASVDPKMLWSSTQSMDITRKAGTG